MLDKDKLFIIIYVDVRNVDRANVFEYIQPIANATIFDESVFRLIIPTRDSETRVECINPVLLTEEQYEETKKRIEGLAEKVKEALDILKENK